MVGEYYKAYNPRSMQKYKLGRRLEQSFKKVNSIYRFVEEIDSDILTRYSDSFRKRLSDVVTEKKRNIGVDTFTNMIKDLAYLKDNPDLVSLIVSYFLHELEIEIDFEDIDSNIEVSSFNDVRELRRLGYYLAKSCADILGHEKGVEFWKKIVALQHRDWKLGVEAAMKEQANSELKKVTMSQRSEGMIKNWIDYGLADFARLIIDDNKVHFRFDSCLTPATMKELNDPEWAYLSSCYVTDAPEYNYGPQRLRRTQTLHNATFCDEFYWDPSAYDNPEQPSLEFTKKLGIDKSG
ncbi:MAG: hypothetical protein ACFFEE_05230 [Candidatus Thorarchaeota archaeon]